MGQRGIQLGIGVQLAHGLLGVRGLVKGRLENEGVSGVLWLHGLLEAAVLTGLLEPAVLQQIEIIRTYRAESHYLFVAPCF